MKRIIIMLISLIVVAAVIYVFGTKFEPENYTPAPVALSIMYSVFINLVGWGCFFGIKEFNN
jgi:hypothetical protein